MSTSVVTLPIADVRAATPRSRIVRIGEPGQPFPYRAGQAVFIGAHGQDLRRPYSIASAPEDTARDGMIELLMGIGSSGAPGAHLERLEPGVMVDVAGPVGRFQFPDVADARHFLFIAGGSGISPLRSMMRHALATKTQRSSPPPIGLIYSARTKDDFAYAHEFEALAREGLISLLLTVTRLGDESAWTGARGRINMTHLREMVLHEDTLCFICGPSALVAEMPPLLKEIGVAREKILMEEW
jgi:ferredoxin-NADP reductase